MVRPYCANAHYWQVYFDTNEAILLAGREASWPVPAPQQVIRQQAEAAPRTVAAV